MDPEDETRSNCWFFPPSWNAKYIWKSCGWYHCFLLGQICCLHTSTCSSCTLFCCERLSASMARSLHLSLSLFTTSRQPAQVVLNEFREPQQEVHNIQEVLDSGTAAVALSLDLSKAFKRIHSYWILHILAIRNAPYWVIQYTKCILLERRAKQKVQGKLLPASKRMTHATPRSGFAGTRAWATWALALVRC